MVVKIFFFFHLFFTLRWTEDSLLIFKKRPYLFWNLQYFCKKSKFVYLVEKIEVLLVEFYSVIHEDEEGYFDFVENEEEVDGYPEWLEMTDNYSEDLTPLEENFEDIFNLEGTFFPRMENTVSRKGLILYDFFELDFYSYEMTEGEILGGIFSPLEEVSSDVRDHSKTFSTWTEHWLTCLFLIPVGSWTTTHEFVLFYQIFSSYVCFKSLDQFLKQIKMEVVEEVLETKMVKPIKSLIIHFLGKLYKYFVGIFLTRVIILYISINFLPPLLLSIFHDLDFFWKRNHYQDHFLCFLMDRWIDYREQHGWIYPFLLVMVIWFLFFLPSMPLASDEAYTEEEDVFSFHYGKSWQAVYNIVRDPHPSFPNPLSRQEKLKYPVTVDPDWLKYPSEEENWLVWTGALYIFFREKQKTKGDWKKWFTKTYWKETKTLWQRSFRWIRCQVLGTLDMECEGKDIRFETSQFYHGRLGKIYWLLSEPLLGYKQQEISQKWSSFWISERENKIYSEIKESIFRWKRGDRPYPWLITKEDQLKWIPGAYGRYKEKIYHRLQKRKKKRYGDIKTFYSNFWRSWDKLEHPINIYRLLPTLDRYIIWSVKRSEQIKEKRKSRKEKKLLLLLSVILCELLFVVVGRMLVPLILFFLKGLSSLTLWICLVRDLGFLVYQTKIFLFLLKILFVISYFFEKRIRGVLRIFLLSIALMMSLLRGRYYSDLWEDEDEGFVWWIREMIKNVGKKTHKKREDIFLHVIDLSTHGVGSMPKTNPLSYFSWFHSWYRRKICGLVEYSHGITLDSREFYEYNSKENSLEQLYENYYGKKRNCDIEKTLLKKGEGWRKKKDKEIVKIRGLKEKRKKKKMEGILKKGESLQARWRWWEFKKVSKMGYSTLTSDEEKMEKYDFYIREPYKREKKQFSIFFLFQFTALVLGLVCFIENHGKLTLSYGNIMIPNYWLTLVLWGGIALSLVIPLPRFFWIFVTLLNCALNVGTTVSLYLLNYKIVFEAYEFKLKLKRIQWNAEKLYEHFDEYCRLAGVNPKDITEEKRQNLVTTLMDPVKIVHQLMTEKAEALKETISNFHWVTKYAMYGLSLGERVDPMVTIYVGGIIIAICLQVGVFLLNSGNKGEVIPISIPVPGTGTGTSVTVPGGGVEAIIGGTIGAIGVAASGTGTGPNTTGTGPNTTGTGPNTTVTVTEANTTVTGPNTTVTGPNTTVTGPNTTVTGVRIDSNEFTILRNAIKNASTIEQMNTKVLNENLMKISTLLNQIFSDITKDLFVKQKELLEILYTILSKVS